MKRFFGARWSTWLRGGIVLTDFEWRVLDSLVSELPTHLRETVEAQFQLYVLAQRESDGHALNFYPAGSALRQLRKGTWRLSVPKLPMECEVAPLMKMRVKLATPPAEVNAVLRAVNGRVFSVSFSEDVRRLRSASGFEVIGVTQAWRSNFPLASAQQAHARDVRNARA
jgi:hypothetical protein